MSIRNLPAGVVGVLLCCGLAASCSSSEGPSAASATAAPATALVTPTPAGTAPSTTVRRAVSDDLRLIEAAGDGNLDEVTALLERGADVRAVDDDGRTALVAAAYAGELDIARALIDAGADVNHQDATRQSAYLIATSEIGEPNGLALLELTLANGADVAALDSYNGTGLIRAADRGFVTIVERLLQTDIAVDHVNRLGWTALLEAIILGSGDDRHVQVVRVLVNGGADVNLADGSGVSPLTHARRSGYQEMVRILEAAGGRDTDPTAPPLPVAPQT